MSTSITVVVDPQQAEKLVLASTQGTIRMTLRNPLDLETVETDGERVSSLLSGTRRAGRSTVRTNVTTAITAPGIIEMYQGGVRTLISYQ